MAPHSCTVELPGEPPKGHGRVRRNYQSPDKLVDSPEEGVNTLVDIVERGARLFPNRNAMGWRDQIKIHNVEKDVTTKVKGKETTQKKTWQYYEMGPYQYKTYRQVRRRWPAALTSRSTTARSRPAPVCAIWASPRTRCSTSARRPSPSG